MKTALALLAMLAAAFAAHADELSGRALAAFQHYDLGDLQTTGFRQTYDLQLQRALTTTSLVRLFVRADDFSGTTETRLLSEKSRSRQIQPIGEFLLNAETLRIQARSEFLDTDTRGRYLETSQTLKRTLAGLQWSPADLPRFEFRGRRSETKNASSAISLTNDTLSGNVSYEWHGVSLKGEERYERAVDDLAGYERTNTTHTGEVSYATTSLGGRLALSTFATAHLGTIEEQALGNRPTSVPVPVPLHDAFLSFDDTPADGRDHPLSPLPSLTDGDDSTSTGISLGPDGVSFINLAFDLERTDQVDEIRVVVRDAAGNPVRNGGGPVDWNVYTSRDGVAWTPVSASVEWSGPLSAYLVSFDLTTARWFKVVNFGVNLEATYVTELLAFYHRELDPAVARNGTQTQYAATTTAFYTPVKRLTLGYTGAYSSLDEDLRSAIRLTSRALEHTGTLQLAMPHDLTLRSQLLLRNARSVASRDDRARTGTVFLDWTPTRQLRTSLELSRDDQHLSDTAFTVDTRAIHVTASVVRALQILLDAGTQTQNFDLSGFVNGGSSATRHFANFTANAQLLRSLRLTVTGSLQNTNTDSTDPAVELLGPTRDHRVAGELFWRPGRPLTISTRVGWVSGGARSGLTERFHIEWYPFGDGSVALGGSYDEDIDPLLDRRARRILFNPRWAINHWATFDLQYTSVSSTSGRITDEQRTFAATLTLTR